MVHKLRSNMLSMQLVSGQPPIPQLTIAHIPGNPKPMRKKKEESKNTEREKGGKGICQKRGRDTKYKQRKDGDLQDMPNVEDGESEGGSTRNRLQILGSQLGTEKRERGEKQRPQTKERGRNIRRFYMGGAPGPMLPPMAFRRAASWGYFSWTSSCVRVASA